MLLAFSATFIPLYTDFVGSRFFSTLCSYKNDAASTQLAKTETHITNAINLFNDLYPTTPLVADDYVKENGRKRKLKWNKSVIEINRRISEEETIPYSSLDILGLQEGVKNPGYTSSFLFVDEGQDINAESFNENAKPFTTATGGIVFVVGTANKDNTSLLYDMNKDENIEFEDRLLFDVYEVLDFKKYEDEDKGNYEQYKARFEAELKKYGKTSTYIRTQYFIDFNVASDGFTSEEELENNNILTGKLTREFSGNEDYRIGAVDPALKRDIAGFIASECNIEQGKVSNNIIDIEMLRRKNEGIKSPDVLVKEIAKFCALHKLDYIALDTTANQQTRAYYLYKELKSRGINTMIIPLDYSSRNKETMFGFLEDSMESQLIKLPSKDCKAEEYKELIDELLYLKKIQSPTTGRIKYKAPNGEDFYDDLVMTLAQVNYAMQYVIENNNKKIDLGGDVVYRLKQNNKFEAIEPKTKKITNWFLGR